ncbi:hypothetical protein V9T40_012663 [Parthenolecanium corni]|uniref:Uncharacterized protein n=1 Tax=Parthenolecanium corni TaxID=536013 RepID=A0AAN9XZI7_9HEMI
MDIESHVSEVGEKKLALSLKHLGEICEMLKLSVKRSEDVSDAIESPIMWLLKRPVEWSKLSFYKYMVLWWFVQKGIYILLSSHSNLYGSEIPLDWQGESEFYLRLNGNFMKLTIDDTYENRIRFSLSFEKPNGKIIERSLTYKLDELEDPNKYTVEKFDGLVLKFVKIEDDLSMQFLVPLIVPLSNGEKV